MKIKNIEKKMKLTFLVAITSFVTSALVVGFTIVWAFNFISNERQSIYVLDNGVPMLVSRTNQLENRDVEHQSHINMFHNLFFSLPPDDDFIKNNLGKAMYLTDESGLKQYNNLKEKSFYNQIISSSSVLSIKTDSIIVDKNLRFKYYGTQRIDRKTSIIKRQLITSGTLVDVPRTVNNPHGLMIKNWKTLENNDISYETKREF
jgi:conjugative transposon TraK protein